MMAFSPRQPFFVMIFLFLVAFAPVSSLGTMHGSSAVPRISQSRSASLPVARSARAVGGAAPEVPYPADAKPTLKTLRMLELITPFGQERFATLFYVFSGADSGFVLRHDAAGAVREGQQEPPQAPQYRVPSSVLRGSSIGAERRGNEAPPRSPRLTADLLYSTAAPEVSEGVSALGLKFFLRDHFGMVLQHIKFLHADSGAEVSETHHVRLPEMIMCRPGNRTPLERWMLVVGGDAPGPAELAAEDTASHDPVTFADVSREIHTLLYTTSSPRRGTALVRSAASGGTSLSRALRLLDGGVFGAALRASEGVGGFLQREADEVDEIFVLALEKTKTFAGLMKALLRLHGNDPSLRSVLDRFVEDLVELTKSRKGGEHDAACENENAQRSSRLRKFGINALVAVAFARDPEFVRRRSLWSRGPAVFTCSRCLPQTPLQRDDLPDEALLLKILPAFGDLLEDLFVARAVDVPVDGGDDRGAAADHAGSAELRAALTFGNPGAETEEDSGALFWLLQDAPEQKLVITTIGQWLTAYVVRRGSPGGGGGPRLGDNETGMGNAGAAGNEADHDVRGAVEVLVRLLVSKVEEVVGAAVRIVQRDDAVAAAQLFLEEMPPLLDVAESTTKAAAESGVAEDLLRPLVTSVGAGIKTVLAELSECFQRRTRHAGARRGDHSAPPSYPTGETSEELLLLSWEQIFALRAIVDRIEVVWRRNEARVLGPLGVARLDVEALRLSAETATAFYHMVAARERARVENEARVENRRVLEERARIVERLLEREVRARAARGANDELREAALERARADVGVVPHPLSAGAWTSTFPAGATRFPAGRTLPPAPTDPCPEGPPGTPPRLRVPRRATNGEALPSGLALVPSPMAVEARTRRLSGGSTTSEAVSEPAHADDPLTLMRRELGELDLAGLDEEFARDHYSAVDSESPSKRPRTGTASAARPSYRWL